MAKAKAPVPETTVPAVPEAPKVRLVQHADGVKVDEIYTSVHSTEAGEATVVSIEVTKECPCGHYVSLNGKAGPFRVPLTFLKTNFKRV